MTDELKDLYNDRDSRLNTVVAPDKYRYWRMLREIKAEHERLDIDDKPTFEQYTLDTYGIQMFNDQESGYISANMQVVDEQKYLLAVLKFT